MGDSGTMAPIPSTVPADPGNASDELTFEGFEEIMKGRGFSEESDPMLTEMGIDHEPDLVAPALNDPDVEAPADVAPQAPSVDALADLTPLELLDHRDAIDTLTAAGYTVDELASMSPATHVKTAQVMRGHQAKATDSSAVESALAPTAEAPAPFDVKALMEGMREELGEKTTGDMGSLFEKLLGHVDQRISKAQDDAATQANGMRLIAEQRLRLEGANPGLKDRPHVMERVVGTVNALLESGLHGSDPEHLFNVAAGTYRLDTEARAMKPKASTRDILGGQPKPSRQLASGAAGPKQTKGGYTYALLAARLNGLSQEAALQKLGPAPTS